MVDILYSRSVKLNAKHHIYNVVNPHSCQEHKLRIGLTLPHFIKFYDDAPYISINRTPITAGAGRQTSNEHHSQHVFNIL